MITKSKTMKLLLVIATVGAATAAGAQAHIRGGSSTPLVQLGGYEGRDEAACRLEGGVSGDVDVHYERISNVTLENCLELCHTRTDCWGYEYKSQRWGTDRKTNLRKWKQAQCHLWNVPIEEFLPNKPHHECFRKQEATNSLRQLHSSTNSTCPKPDPDEVCPLLYQPVLCGEEECEYDNTCFAELAGYDSSECTDYYVLDGFISDSNSTNTTDVGPEFSNETCREAGSGICIWVYKPVICGPLECEYSNACFAKLAGYNETDCDPKCQSYDLLHFQNITDDVCGLHNTYNPVVCGNVSKCGFDNLCLAKYGGQYEADECRLVCPSVEESSSRRSSSLVECDSFELDPVICGEARCEYDNLCWATHAAGYDEDQCSPVNGTDVPRDGDEHEEMPPMECKTPYPYGAPCDRTLKPVECVDKSNKEACIYPNICVANEAGWSKSQCEFTDGVV